jgi:hypothetical protein
MQSGIRQTLPGRKYVILVMALSPVANNLLGRTVTGKVPLEKGDGGSKKGLAPLSTGPAQDSCLSRAGLRRDGILPALCRMELKPARSFFL